MKIYIDGQNTPKRSGWVHIKTFSELQQLLEKIPVEVIDAIYIGRHFEDDEREDFPEMEMTDCALLLIEKFKGKPLPECIVKKNGYKVENPAGLLRYYSRGYKHKDLCQEII